MPRIGAPSGGAGVSYDDTALAARIAALETSSGSTTLRVAGSETITLAAGATGALTALGATPPASAVGVSGETLSGVLCAGFGSPPATGDHVAFAAGATPMTPAMDPGEVGNLQLRVFYDAAVVLTYWEYTS